MKSKDGKTVIKEIYYPKKNITVVFKIRKMSITEWEKENEEKQKTIN